MLAVLSTKKLSENQRSLLLNASISLVEYNAIKIEFVSFEVPSNIGNAIFTSQNAVKAVMSYELGVMSCFCVGEKTKSLLEENGQKVIKMTEYASELADYLVKNHKNDSFHFFCGNIRSDEIPSILKENNIAFEEIEVYKTTLNPKKFERNFDAVLFFSPSGVRSFVEGNTNNNNIPAFAGMTKAVCIGTTTAQEAKKYTENVVISNATTVESVIAKAVKILKK
ncbi:MAG: uroporphyrinogen-III synthase [Flavobacteriaceae bacterium]|nr:uroporphyrinogen-III synthase [Flavobacteriaceae bacterium]